MEKLLLLTLIIIQSVAAQDGGLDFSFQPPNNFNGTVEAIELQQDGKIIVGGGFSNLYRLNTDGTEDTTFLNGSGPVANVYALAIQSDQKIIVGGSFQGGIKRLNPNGLVDLSFTCTVTDAFIRNIKVLANGKIMIAGVFTMINGTPINGIARLNADGSLDTTFNLNLPQSVGIRDFDFQSDGKMLIAGEFTNGGINELFTRYNTDNSIDFTFNASGSGANSNIYDISVQDDDKIMITGWFTEYNDVSRRCIAGLNSDGSLDNTFQSYNLIDSTGTLYSIFGAKKLADNKYIIHGSFHSYDGASSSGIAKLNPDGTRDVTFNMGTGAEGFVWATKVQPDGKILIGGEFNAYNSTPRNKIARIGNTLSVPETAQKSEWVLYPNPCNTYFSISGDSNIVIHKVAIVNAVGQLVKTQTIPNDSDPIINVDDLPTGTYFARMYSDTTSSYQRFIKQ